MFLHIGILCWVRAQHGVRKMARLIDRHDIVSSYALSLRSSRVQKLMPDPKETSNVLHRTEHTGPEPGRKTQTRLDPIVTYYFTRVAKNKTFCLTEF